MAETKGRVEFNYLVGELFIFGEPKGNCLVGQFEKYSKAGLIQAIKGSLAIVNVEGKVAQYYDRVRGFPPEQCQKVTTEVALIYETANLV